MRDSIRSYCVTIGKDPMLVQGAGGNVSWKDGSTLWVKASGTWLAEAEEKDIFVPVDLADLHQALSNDDFSVIPKVTGNSNLRGSIETLLHAVMPHRVVVHVHAIEILVHMVRYNSQIELGALLGDLISWTIVDYHKPGPLLAAAVSKALSLKPNTNIIFLKNHGVVIGAHHIEEISEILHMLTNRMRCTQAKMTDCMLEKVPAQFNQYIRHPDHEVNQLAINAELFHRLYSDWALYPDHVVFLGTRAYAYKTFACYFLDTNIKHFEPEIIFILGAGVYIMPSLSKAKFAQIRAYYDVLSRVEQHHLLTSLSKSDMSELIDWDAEKYRVSVS